MSGLVSYRPASALGPQFVTDAKIKGIRLSHTLHCVTHFAIRVHETRVVCNHSPLGGGGLAHALQEEVTSATLTHCVLSFVRVPALQFLGQLVEIGDLDLRLAEECRRWGKGFTAAGRARRRKHDKRVTICCCDVLSTSKLLATLPIDNPVGCGTKVFSRPDWLLLAELHLAEGG